MSRSSNDNGRAFEYEIVLAFKREISKYRTVKIKTDSGFQAAKEAHGRVSAKMIHNLRSAALATVETVIEYEPLIIDMGKDYTEISIQTDSIGRAGDVRDILIARPDISWEIGISAKHNHDAVKHSRLSKRLDFGEVWYNVPCSSEYWADVEPIFARLTREKEQGTLWRELPNKQQSIYLPLLRAFMAEIRRSNVKDKNLAKNMVEYLVGTHDFYKAISRDKKRITEVKTFNLRGTLNKPIKGKRRIKIIEISRLPTRIIHIGLVPNSSTTVEMCLDRGWAFTFRIHNASSKVEASLKFDVKLIGIPATILSIETKWRE